MSHSDVSFICPSVWNQRPSRENFKLENKNNSAGAKFGESGVRDSTVISREETVWLKKQDLYATPWHYTWSEVAPGPWIFGEARDDCRTPPKPPYSPDLDHADYFSLFFLRRKSTPKRRRFQTEEEIEENSLLDLRAIPQHSYQNAFQNWLERWKWYIDNGRE
jgi:hypothetical protein